MTRVVPVHLAFALMGALGVCGALAEEIPLPASTVAVGLDRQINWDSARQLAVQDDQRNKTLDSFAREKMLAMTNRDHLPGLSPMASLMEWLFNWRAYVDEPVVHIKDKGLRIEFGLTLPADLREDAYKTGKFTPRQMAQHPIVDRIEELAPRFEMGTAMRRVGEARFVAFNLSDMLRIVPATVNDADAAWARPEQLIDNLDDQSLAALGLELKEHKAPVVGLDSPTALRILAAWSRLRASWQEGDASGVQQSLDQLAATLPTVAGEGVYPSESQRNAEMRYYAMGKFTWGWMIYFVAALAGFWAMMSGARTPWVAAVGLLAIALGL
ncbi:MAG: hypothetical protein KDA32_06425, partial [Phycisphaerales bacterium]|nr:hypothetical protein [Phycisphaerales bacterium]